ncbi:MAG: acyl-CoA dehydrogenase N-terminal domain-containing protein [Polyangiaceae bacterium]
MTYSAPVKDLLFNIEHLAGLEEIGRLPAFAEVSPDIAAAVLEECGKFCEQVIAPLNAPGDHDPSTWHDGQVSMSAGFREAYAAFVTAGWQSVQHSTDHGGQGLPKVIGAACSEMLNSANISFALCPLLTDGAIEALTLAGSENMKAAYLGNLISGRWNGTMNLTEPPRRAAIWGCCAPGPSGRRTELIASSAPRSSSPMAKTT